MIGNVLNEFFKELGRKKDYDGLKACIVSLIRKDPTFESGKYDEVEDYLKKNDLQDIFQAYAAVPGEPKAKEKSKWDEDYFADCAFALRENFSRERLAHVKEVGKYVYRDKPTPGKEEAAKRTQEVLSNIIRDLKSLKIKISFSNDFLKGYRLNKDNKEEFKRLVMGEIKKQLKIKNESANIFSEIKFI